MHNRMAALNLGYHIAYDRREQALSVASR